MAVRPAGSTPVLIGRAAAPLRRALPASAWVALECLVARSHPAPDGRVVEIGVRDLAAELGGSKNTAHRALTVLTRAGVIEPEHRRRPDGTYLPTRYRLHLDPDTLTTYRPTRRTPSIHTDDPNVEPTQLTLLDQA